MADMYNSPFRLYCSYRQVGLGNMIAQDRFGNRANTHPVFISTSRMYSGRKKPKHGTGKNYGKENTNVSAQQNMKCLIKHHYKILGHLNSP